LGAKGQIEALSAMFAVGKQHNCLEMENSILINLRSYVRKGVRESLHLNTITPPGPYAQLA
jgi:hypothetical protein